MNVRKDGNERMSMQTISKNPGDNNIILNIAACDFKSNEFQTLSNGYQPRQSDEIITDLI